jgi:RNA-directed DNA polymerase
MAGLRRRYARLRLKVNEAKSAVAPAFERKFLGYCLWVAPRGEVKRAVAAKAKAAFKQRVRWLTKRNGGRSMDQVVHDLRGYVLGWKAYFRLAQTPRVMRELDEWLRHRLRALQLKPWRRGSTIYRALRALGASHEHARQVAGNSRCWWRNSRHALNRTLTIGYFDRLGVPHLS